MAHEIYNDPRRSWKPAVEPAAAKMLGNSAFEIGDVAKWILLLALILVAVALWPTSTHAAERVTAKTCVTQVMMVSAPRVTVGTEIGAPAVITDSSCNKVAVIIVSNIPKTGGAARLIPSWTNVFGRYQVAITGNPGESTYVLR